MFSLTYITEQHNIPWPCALLINIMPVFYLLIQACILQSLDLSMLSVCLEMHNIPSCFLPKSPEAQPQLNLLKAVLGAGETIRISKHTLLQSTI